MFLGMYPQSDVDYDDYWHCPGPPVDIEIWSANEAYTVLPERRKPDRIFQIHPRDWREDERRFLRQTPEHDCFGRTAEHVEYLRTCGVPVYGQQVWDDIPTSVRYPFEAVTAAVGVPLPPDGKRRLWATSTWGYMAALLLLERSNGDEYWPAYGNHTQYGQEMMASHKAPVDELWLQGVELPRGTNRERIWEWPNLAYYLGMMTTLGIKIVLPIAGSSLLSAPHYALGGNPKVWYPDHWWSPSPAVVREADGVRYWGPMEAYE